MQHLVSSVIANSAIADGYFALDFQMPNNVQAPKPGQFLTIRVKEGISPLLRRPFAFASFDPLNNTARIIYERRGKATATLSSFGAGDSLDLISPLGNTFPEPGQGKQPVLVAGGIGTGPILFLYDAFRAQGLDPLLCVGSRSGSRIPKLPDGAIICTDDGSTGIKGTVLRGLEDLSSKLKSGFNPEFYACGPHVMMENLYNWAALNFPGSSTWVSLEQTMACAVGACMGCVVKVDQPKPFARVCTEGPVFDASFIIWKD